VEVDLPPVVAVKRAALREAGGLPGRLASPGMYALLEVCVCACVRVRRCYTQLHMLVLLQGDLTEPGALGEALLQAGVGRGGAQVCACACV
jgi:hypothetical protein